MPRLSRNMESAMSYVLGIDPDLDTTAFAFVDANTTCVELVGVARPLKGVGRKVERMVAAINVAFTNIACDTHEFTYSQKIRDAFERGRIFCTVVEGQQIYQGVRQRPDDILRLSQVAGGGAGIASHLCGATRLLMPRPQEWKGSVPKPIHQARVLERLGWPYERKGPAPKRTMGKVEHSGYCVPTSVPSDVALYDVRPSDWKHIVDAIGLALWGVDQLKSATASGCT